MARYPYAQGPSKLFELWSKMRAVAKPTRVDREWLARLGFSNKNDLTMVSVLKHLGYVDADGVPTSKWNTLRHSEQNTQTLRESILEVYKDLYEIYPEAHELDGAHLLDFFRAADPNIGDTAIKLVIGTFRTLCGLAGMDTSPATASPERGGRTTPNRSSPRTEAKTNGTSPPTFSPHTGLAPSPQLQQLQLHVNIQLHLPATSDADVYEKLFLALQRHLLASKGD